MRTRILIALAVVLVAASPASAHMLTSSTTPAKLPAKQQLSYAVHTISHARATIKLAKAQIAHNMRILRRHPRFSSYDANWVQFDLTVQQQLAKLDLHDAKVMLYNHRWLLGFGLRLQRQAEASLNPWKVPGYFMGQALCVHRGEGSFTADTGNGFGGGMQFMVGTWNHAASLSHGKLPHVDKTSEIAAMPPAAQIYAAYLIVVVEGSGWGQWPNTARACGLL